MTNIIQTLEGLSLKYDSQEITIQQALAIFARSYVDFDRQRWGGVTYHSETGNAVSRGAGWNLKKGKEYIQNVFLNLNLNQIIAVDLPAVIAYCNRNNKASDAEYFIKLSHKILPNSEMGEDSLTAKYLIEDAHNTLSYLNAYVEGRFTVKVPGQKKDKKFTALPEDLQQYFMSKKISIKIIIGATVDLLHKNIISVNSSLVWSKQDCRNAYNGGNIASFVRKCADLDEKLGTRAAFTCVMSNSEAQKRETDKIFAQHLMYEYAKSGASAGVMPCNDASLDSFYYQTKNINEKLEKRTKDILSTMANMLKDQSTKSLLKGQWSNMWLLVSNCIENVYKIKDYKAVLDAYLGFLWRTEEDEATRGWTDFEKETESFVNASYYFYFSQRTAKEIDSEGVPTGNKKIVMTWEMRENKIKEWFATVETDFIEKGAISKIRKSKDAYSKSQKRAMFVEGHVDPDIAASDVFSQTKHIEADHIVPVAQGGTTTPDNGRLIPRKANRAKGAKVNEAL